MIIIIGVFIVLMILVIIGITHSSYSIEKMERELFCLPPRPDCPVCFGEGIVPGKTQSGNHYVRPCWCRTRRGIEA